MLLRIIKNKILLILAQKYIIVQIILILIMLIIIRIVKIAIVIVNMIKLIINWWIIIMIRKNKMQ